jgi:orotidine-5'-phosphate decarboxylase
MEQPANPVFCAIDASDLSRAEGLARAVAGAAGGIKLGKEFFTANGPAGVRRVQAAAGLPLFLDLKWHDIPNTVAGAVRAALPLKPFMLNVHASGGPAMLKAAREAAGGETLVIAVTVLTSLDDSDLDAVGLRGPASARAVALARLSQDCGLDGVVCSAHEIAAIRAACGPAFRLVVPGVRPAGAEPGDQKRVMTPGDAKRAGADFLVVGRPIAGAADPAAAARAIVESL